MLIFSIVFNRIVMISKVSEGRTFKNGKDRFNAGELIVVQMQDL